MPGQAKSIKHQPRYRGERAPADLEFDAANGKVDYSAFYRFLGINIGITEKKGVRSSQEDRVTVNRIEFWGLLSSQEQTAAFKAACALLQTQINTQQEPEYQAWLADARRKARAKQKVTKHSESGATAVFAVTGKNGVLASNLGDAEGLRVVADAETPVSLTPELHDCHSAAENQRIRTLINSEAPEVQNQSYEGTVTETDALGIERERKITISRGINKMPEGKRLATGSTRARGALEPTAGFGDSGYGNLVLREPATNHYNHLASEQRTFDIYACDGLREGFAEPILKQWYRDRHGYVPDDGVPHDYRESILDDPTQSTRLTSATNKAIQKFINDLLKHNADITTQDLSEVLAQEAIERGSCDNVSVQVVEITPQEIDPEVGILTAVYDGHSGEKTSQHLADHFNTVLQAQVLKKVLSKESELSERLNALKSQLDELLQRAEVGEGYYAQLRVVNEEVIARCAIHKAENKKEALRNSTAARFALQNADSNQLFQSLLAQSVALRDELNRLNNDYNLNLDNTNNDFSTEACFDTLTKLFTVDEQTILKNLRQIHQVFHPESVGSDGGRDDQQRDSDSESESEGDESRQPLVAKPSTLFEQSLNEFREVVLQNLDDPDGGYTTSQLVQIAAAGVTYAKAIKRIHDDADMQPREKQALYIEASKQFRHQALMPKSTRQKVKGVAAGGVCGLLTGAVAGCIASGGGYLGFHVIAATTIAAALGPIGWAVVGGIVAVALVGAGIGAGVGFWAGSRKSASERAMDSEINKTAKAAKSYALSSPSARAG